MWNVVRQGMVMYDITEMLQIAESFVELEFLQSG